MNTPDDAIGRKFNYYIDDKKIVAHSIGLRHPKMQVPVHFWQSFSGADLWGCLRHWPVESVFVTMTEPLYLIVEMNHEPPAYIKITWQEYSKFLQYYGASVADKTNWSKEGF